jgi:putative membrane protein
MKKLKFFLLLGGIAMFSACSNSSNNDSGQSGSDTTANHDTMASANTSADTAMHSTTAPTTSSAPVAKDDSSFTMEAAHGGLMEVQLGTYAQQNASSERVKAFGAMMVRDHSKANDELKAIAASKNLTLPASMDDKMKKDMDNLMKKTGRDFDKAYMNMMLDDHKKDVKEFEKASDKCQDPDIKGFASKTLPVLRTHLDSAKAIAGSH